MGNEIQNIVYEFILPYALDLKDNFQKLEESYIVIIDNLPVQIRTERIFNNHENIVIRNGKINNDRLGIVSKTKVQIWFDEKIINSGLIDKELLLISPRELLLLGLKYLNKFLFDYKRLTEEYWIFPIKPEYILNYFYYKLDKNGKELNRGNASFSFQTGHFNGGDEIFIGEEIDNIFRNKLVDNNSYNLQQDLISDIYNNYDLENYNLVIIQNSILFENYIYRFLNGLLISKREIDKMKKKEVCGCLVGVYETCTKGFSSLGFNFKDTNEFINFHENVLKIRNKLIHGEKLDNVSKKEAFNAIEYTKKAINYISNNLVINISE